MKRILLGAVLFGVLAFGLRARAPAQGCSQCRESVGQTPARTQKAYREGIAVMILAAGCVCAATVIVVRRFR